jgi:hypothetical protein
MAEGRPWVDRVLLRVNGSSSIGAWSTLFVTGAEPGVKLKAKPTVIRAT